MTWILDDHHCTESTAGNRSGRSDHIGGQAFVFQGTAPCTEVHNTNEATDQDCGSCFRVSRRIRSPVAAAPRIHG